MKILQNDVHNSWSAFLTDGVIEQIKDIEKRIGDNINPVHERVLRFMQCDLKSLKVVILGQDPYPEKGRATGRSFEVGDLHSWNDKFRQVSLKNIIRLIHKGYTNIENYNDIKKFSDIQKEIREETFKILQPDQIFASWERQGVLMLNTYLSVECGISGSHISIWEPFSIKMFKYISQENKDLKWFLWGKQAEDKKQYIGEGMFYISRHPMMCSSKYEDDFLRNDCFKDTMGIINWLGI